MSTPHHGQQEKLMRRFNDQRTRQYERTFPCGRLNENDDGDLTFAIAADMKKGVVVVEFAHETRWIALEPEYVEQLIEALQEKLFQLRGITT